MDQLTAVRAYVGAATDQLRSAVANRDPAAANRVLARVEADGHFGAAAALETALMNTSLRGQLNLPSAREGCTCRCNHDHGCGCCGCVCTGDKSCPCCGAPYRRY